MCPSESYTQTNQGLSTRKATIFGNILFLLKVVLHLNNTPLLVKLSSICNYITLLGLAHISIKSYCYIGATFHDSTRRPKEMGLSFDNSDSHPLASHLLRHLSRARQSVQLKRQRYSRSEIKRTKNGAVHLLRTSLDLEVDTWQIAVVQSQKHLSTSSG